MRRLLSVLVLVTTLLFVIASCADDAPEPRSQVPPGSAQDESELAREMLESYTGHMNALLDELERIAPLPADGEEGIADANGDGSLSEVQDIRASIRNHIAELERRIAGGASPAPALSKPGGEPERSGPSDQEIARLRREADAASAARAQVKRVAAEKVQLERSLDGAQEELDKLRTRASQLEELSGAYVMALTRGELGAMRDKDHLRRRGIAPGTYEPTSRTLPLGATGRTIVAVDPTARAIFLGSRVSDARVLSAHRHYDDLFTIQRRDGQMALLLKNPTAFWRISRYLIVEVE